MLPFRTRLDPEGYYKRLGLNPAATRADVITAFRAKARVFHPDVARTGNVGKFVAVKQAYDVLSNEEARAAYDRKAQELAQPAPEPEPPPQPRTTRPRTTKPETVHPAPAAPTRRPRLFEIPVLIWGALATFLCLCVYQVVAHLLIPARTVRDHIRPNAAIVAPLSPSAHQAVLYGPLPVQLAGKPNFYVIPAAGSTMLWRLDPQRNVLVPGSPLPPFSAVQAVRLVRQIGMLEVRVNDHANGFISADHLAPGDAAAARQAYCRYNSGPTPADGELLERHGVGSGTIEVENQALQPAVIKLRDETGAVALSVFLAPGGHAVMDGLPEGSYYTEFAIGELWSRACNAFAAGMRARRADAVVKLPGDAHLIVAPEAGKPAAVDIPDASFERK